MQSDDLKNMTSAVQKVLYVKVNGVCLLLYVLLENIPLWWGLNHCWRRGCKAYAWHKPLSRDISLSCHTCRDAGPPHLPWRGGCHTCRDAGAVTPDVTRGLSHLTWRGACHTCRDAGPVTPAVTRDLPHLPWRGACHTCRDAGPLSEDRPSWVVFYDKPGPL